MTKICSVCGKEKEIQEFSPTSCYKGEMMFRGDCKECNAKRANKRYHADPERFRLAARKWKAKNPQKVVNNKRWNTYRIRPEEYEDLMEAQGGKCAICENKMKVPHLDHCHASGKVRGILCSNCNTGLGKLGDSVLGLEKAIRYLQKNS